MSDTVIVADFRTRAEAELAAKSLDGAGIPYVIQSAEGMLHGPFPPGAQIRVLAQDEEAARDVLADLTGDRPPSRKRLVALGTYEQDGLDQAVARLEAAEIPYVVEHPDAGSARWVLYVRREHQIPAGRVLQADRA